MWYAVPSLRPSPCPALLAVFAIFALFLAVPAPTAARQAAATVVAVRGPVEVERDGGRQRLRPKAEIFEQDTIRTNSGRVQVMFTDHTLVSLGRDTVFRVSEYRYRSGDTNSALRTRVEEGVFRVVGGAITALAPDNFKTETPTATIGIRGSMYSGILRNMVLSVLFEGGRGIYVTNPRGSVDLTRPSLMTTVQPQQPPAPPRRATAADIQQFFQALTTTGDQGHVPGSGGSEEGGQQTGTGDEGGDTSSGAPAGAATSGDTTGGSGAEGPLALTPLAEEADDQGGILDLTPPTGPSDGTSTTSDTTDTVTTTITEVVTTATQEQTTTQVTETGTTGGEGTTTGGTPPDTTGGGSGTTLPAGATGGMLTALMDGSTDGVVASRFGTVTLAESTTPGLFTGSLTDRTDGTTLPLTLDETNGLNDPNTPGFLYNDQTRQVDLLGAPHTLDFFRAYFTPGHDIHHFSGWSLITDTNGIDNPYLEIGYAGIPTTTLPAGGAVFDGAIQGVVDSGTAEFVGLPGTLWCNFDTGMVLGWFHDDGTASGPDVPLGEAVLIGRLNGNDLTGLTLYGGGSPMDNNDFLLLQTAPDGAFYGGGAQAFGFLADGTLTRYLTTDTLPLGAPVAGGPFQLLATGLQRPTAPAFSLNGASYTGFFKGLEAYWRSDQTLEGLDLDWGSLDITVGANGDVTVSGDLTGDLGRDNLTLSTIQGGAVADDLFLAILANGEPNAPPGYIATLERWSAMTGGLAVGGKLWLPGSRPQDEIEARWAATALPQWTAAGPPSVPSLWRGPVDLVQADPAVGLFGDSLRGNALVLFAGNGSWRGRFTVAAADQEPWDLEATGASDGGSFWGTLSSGPWTDNDVLGNFYGTNPDLLLGEIFGSDQADPNSPGRIAGVIGGVPDDATPLLTGAFLGDDLFTGRMGSATAINDGGTVFGFADTTDWWTSSWLEPLDFTMPAPATGTWTPLVDTSWSHLWTGISFTGTAVTSSLGDFGYWYVPPSPFTDPNDPRRSGTYQMFTVLGRAPAVLPTTGVDRFAGAGLAIFRGNDASLLDRSEVGINWHNHKVIIHLEGADPTRAMGRTLLIGGLDANGVLTSPHLLGSTPIPWGFATNPTGIGVLDLTVGGATVLGTDAQGVAFNARGQLFDLGTDLASVPYEYRLQGAAIRSGREASATGTATWEGFVSGIAEDMSNIADRHLFLNQDPTEVHLTVDRDNGTVTGTLRAADQGLSAAATVLDLDVGGRDSVYITDQAVAATIDDASGAGVSTGGATTTLKGPATSTSWLASDPAAQTSSYLTWGYWETAWVDPANSATYHVHPPGTYWVAGERTPAAAVQNLMDTRATGTYTGQAMGARIDTVNPSNPVTPLPTGTVNLAVDFSRANVADAVSGSITFPTDATSGFAGRTLPIGSAASTLTTGGFAAMVTDAQISQVNGAFYGPNAEAMGGNFHAVYPSETYSGVFVANKVAP